MALSGVNIKVGGKIHDRSNRKEKVHPQLCGQEGGSREGGEPAPGGDAHPAASTASPGSSSWWMTGRS